MLQVLSMMATICGRFRLELDPQMGGEAGVLERQISSFTLAVDGGLFIQFHDRTQVRPLCSQKGLQFAALWPLFSLDM